MRIWMQNEHVWSRLALGVGLAASLALGGRAEAQAREITMADAQRIALERVPGEVESIERDREGGVAVFEVEVRDAQGVEHEIVIDAASGSVVRVEQDLGDDDDAEDENAEGDDAEDDEGERD